jgi:uncharacterized membrane protein YdjX (TVP38/TMEM64 family)
VNLPLSSTISDLAALLKKKKRLKMSVGNTHSLICTHLKMRYEVDRFRCHHTFCRGRPPLYIVDPTALWSNLLPTIHIRSKMHSAALISRSDAKKIASLLVIIALILVICDAALYQSYHVKTATDATLSWMYYHAGVTLGLYIFLMILSAWFFVPPSLLVLASGFIFPDIYAEFGIAIACISSVLGAMIGGTLAYGRAPGLSHDLLNVVCERYPILSVVNTAIVKNPLKVMMLLRLNPLLPFGVLNCVFAMKGVDMALFLVAIVAVMPWYLFLICVGAAVSSIMYSSYSFIGYTIAVACGAVVMVIVWRFAKDELQREVELHQWRKVVPDDEEMSNSDGDGESVSTKRNGNNGDGESVSTKRNGNKGRWFKRLAAKMKTIKASNNGSKTQSEQAVTVVEPVDPNVVENSDLSGADYVRTQVLGDDNVSNVAYRLTLDAPAIILDDFS